MTFAGNVHLSPARGPRRVAIGVLLAAASVAVGIAVWLATATAARASTPLSLTYDATATCPVTVTGDCSYANVDAALQSALSGGSAQWALNIPGLAVGGGAGPTIAGAAVTEDATAQSLVISGSLNGGLPIQATAVWPSGATAPELALAVKAPDGALNALNSLWSSSADPQLTGAVLLSSPDSTYQFDPAQLPAASQTFYPAALGTPTLNPGLTLFAGVNVGATADPTLKNVLEYLGVGQTATVTGTVSQSFAPLLSPTLATAADKAGLDLTLSSTETGGTSRRGWTAAPRRWSSSCPLRGRPRSPGPIRCRPRSAASRTRSPAASATTRPPKAAPRSPPRTRSPPAPRSTRLSGSERCSCRTPSSLSP